VVQEKLPTLIIGVKITRREGMEYIDFPGSDEIGIHTKHLVGGLADERGPGVSFRRNDTKEEFYWLPSGTWRSIAFVRSEK